jgi:phosphatidylglycerol:prolipoprotein diacylglycerol transferase
MGSTSTISFPGLGIGEFKIDSVAFTVFGREIAWYGLIITCAIVSCFFYIRWRAKEISLKTDDLLDMFLPTVIFGVIGARLYYVLTTIQYGGYKSFIDVIAIWEGGLAIYGGLIAGAITVIVAARIKRIPFFKLADCICPSLLFAQALGRWGNFTNGEAFGSETDIFCRMGLMNHNTGWRMMYVHPTFLYESLWNILGFTLINLFYRHRKYDGQIFHLTFAWYGFGRMFIELLRTDSLYISSHHAWYTKISVLVGFAFFVGCTAWMILKLIRIRSGKEKGRKTA